MNITNSLVYRVNKFTVGDVLTGGGVDFNFLFI